jgi:hypothetical protein
MLVVVLQNYISFTHEVCLLQVLPQAMRRKSEKEELHGKATRDIKTKLSMSQA